MPESPAPFGPLLHSLGRIRHPDARLTPLTGGVSCEIFLVEDGNRRFVVKRALAKLKVAADWYADVSRNHTEQACLRTIAQFRPDAVPAILFSDESHGLFAMDYLDGFANWKTDLLKGTCDPALARTAGSLLGAIHAQTWNDPDARKTFATGPTFQQLRLDPYLRATAEKHPLLSEAILAEWSRLAATHECLVHGDFSPKNLLHQNGRLVILDCEAAWFGDPCFDLSFFLNHFFLKSLYHAPARPPLPGMIAEIRAGYRASHPAQAGAIESRTATLLPMLMLARVDGKSPVEYLTDDAKISFVRSIASRMIQHPPSGLDELSHLWFQQLDHSFP
jgi:aminoglycoside phosphotransferase (APT) family kinase protein